MTKHLSLNLLTICLVSFVALTSCQSKAPQRKITIKAAIIYNFGGAQAVARENFYLLSKDAIQIWKDAGLIYGDAIHMLDIFRLDMQLGRQSKFADAIKPHIVTTITTDFDGNGTFENVQPGTFFIYGVTETRSGIAIWSYKVAENDDKPVLLDSKNAVYAR